MFWNPTELNVCDINGLDNPGRQSVTLNDLSNAICIRAYKFGVCGHLAHGNWYSIYTTVYALAIFNVVEQDFKTYFSYVHQNRNTFNSLYLETLAFFCLVDVVEDAMIWNQESLTLEWTNWKDTKGETLKPIIFFPSWWAMRAIFKKKKQKNKYMCTCNGNHSQLVVKEGGCLIIAR